MSVPDGRAARPISRAASLLGDLAPLTARASQFVLAGLAWPLPAGDGRGSAEAAARHLVQRHLARVTMVQADDDHAAAEAGARPDDDDGVVLRQVAEVRDRRGVIGLVMRRFGDDLDGKINQKLSQIKTERKSTRRRGPHAVK